MTRASRPAEKGAGRALRWLASAAVALSAVAVVAVGAALYALRDMDARLPPLPDIDRIETSVMVVDRDGALLRPFTIADGRWRLPVAVGDVDPR